TRSGMCRDTMRQRTIRVARSCRRLGLGWCGRRTGSSCGRGRRRMRGGWVVRGVGRSNRHEPTHPATERDEATMKASQVRRAMAAATSVAAALDLTADDAIVLHDSNRLVLRLMPCDVVARVAPLVYQAGAELEVEIAGRLAETDCPVAALELRVE